MFPVSLLALVPTAALTRPARHLGLGRLGVGFGSPSHGDSRWRRAMGASFPAGDDSASHGAGRSRRGGCVRRGPRTSHTGYVDRASLDCWTRDESRRLSGTSRGEAHVSACGFGHGFSDVSGRCRLDECLGLDQVAASLHGSRVFLYAANQSRATEALVELTRANTRRVTLVWTTEEGRAPADSAVHGTCFDVVNVREIPDRSLRVAFAQC